MKKGAALLALVPLLSLSGCIAAAIPLAARATMTPVQVVTQTVTVTAAAPTAAAHHLERLRCGNNDIQLELIGDYLAAVVNGTHRVQLHQGVSASGARYVDESHGIALWNHHDEWMLVVNDGAANEQQVMCTAY